MLAYTYIPKYCNQFWHLILGSARSIGKHSEPISQPIKVSMYIYILYIYGSNFPNRKNKIYLDLPSELLFLKYPDIFNSLLLSAGFIMINRSVMLYFIGLIVNTWKVQDEYVNYWITKHSLGLSSHKSQTFYVW